MRYIRGAPHSAPGIAGGGQHCRIGRVDRRTGIRAPKRSGQPHTVRAMSFAKLLVAFQADDAGLDALALGAMLAEATKAELIAAHVSSGSAAEPSRPTRLGRADEPDEDGWPAALRRAAERLRITIEPWSLAGRSPADALRAFAESESADVIVLGPTHRAGLGALAPGSMSDQLVKGAPCCVAIAPPRFRFAYEAARGLAERPEGMGEIPWAREQLRVLEVGFDGSPESRLALDVAAELGRAAGATLRVVTVAHHVPHEELAPIDWNGLLHGAVAGLPRELRALPIREEGDPAARLLARAEEGVDVLVVGSRRRGPWRRVVLGSVSGELARRAPCPVLIVPRPARGEFPSAAPAPRPLEPGPR